MNVEKLKKEIEQLDAKKQLLKNKLKSDERKKETRLKIILGAAAIKANLVNQIKPHLSERDRKTVEDILLALQVKD